MSKHSHAAESFSHFVVALVGATIILGAAAWAMMAFDNHGCSGGISCRSEAERTQVNY